MFPGSGIDIEIDVDADKAQAYLARMGARALDFSAVFRWAKDELERSNAANFAANGVPSGKAWAPLDPQYGAWKSVNFPGRSTLIRSGRLFRSLTDLSGPPNVITPQTASFGTRVEYAKFHQNGTFKMPKRQIVFEPPLFAQRVADKAADYVANGTI